MKRKKINRLLMEKLEELYFQKNNVIKKFSDKSNMEFDECIYFYCVLTNREIEQSPAFMDYMDGLMPDEDWRKVPIEYITKDFKNLDCFFICTNKKKKYVDNGDVRFITFFEFLKHIGEVEAFLNFEYTAPHNLNEPVSEDWLRTEEMPKQHQVNKQGESENIEQIL